MGPFFSECLNPTVTCGKPKTFHNSLCARPRGWDDYKCRVLDRREDSPSKYTGAL